MGITSLPEISAVEFLRFPERHIQQELETLAGELRQVQEQIDAIKTTVYGLAVIYGSEIVGPELHEAVRPARPARRLGLARACRSVLQNAVKPCSVSEICNRLNAMNGNLLIHHRNPMASVMSILRSLASQGEVIRSAENGRSVWQLASATDRPADPEPAPTEPACFQ